MQKIFVIDNDLERRNFFYNILSQLNYSVTTLPSFSQLLEALGKERPQSIIIDVGSEDKMVGTVIRKIREVSKGIQIITLVSGNLEEDMESSLGATENVICLNKDMPQADMVPHLLQALRIPEAETGIAKVSLTETIFIIDDEEEVSIFLKDYLIARGYKVDNASNGEEALLKIKATNPKVVLLDIMMPGMDGLLVLKHIKEIDKSIEVIITSGLSDPSVIEQTRKLGADVYLNKPFSLEKLEAVILTSVVKQGE